MRASHCLILVVTSLAVGGCEPVAKHAAGTTSGTGTGGASTAGNPSDGGATLPVATATSSAQQEKSAPPRGLYLASARTIEEALRTIGWTPRGSYVASFKGVTCTTVLASRDGVSAEVKSCGGYVWELQDMLQLKGSAQGIRDMAMVTVLVNGDAAKTDELYEQLVGSAPMRHGSGLGHPFNRK